MDYQEKDDIATHRQEYDRMLAAIGFKSGAQAFESALDVGGGGAMHSAFLTRIAKRVICTDFIDQNARYGGEFIKLLREKFERNDEPFNARSLEFHAGDAMNLVYKNAAFDLVVSFNALEHIPDPSRAVAEIIRVLKPGGLAYLTFDPIWSCDTGSHFFHRVPTPWEHLLVPQDEYALRMREAGSNDEEVGDFLHAMNKVRLDTFRRIFKTGLSQVKVLSYQEWQGVADESHLRHPNFGAARALGYSEEDLMVRGICVVLRRENAQASAMVATTEPGRQPFIRRILGRR
ncbi:class I SAM-dependent methyltransferase [Dyella soli]|uniref:Class I SAM-dependent methyltransferase n=1 Tax=Dyella soli TaxID=522319 RepID=A0A4R0YQ84_9GAMM|nr:class I SAM-dependent methyltransferase [Dyella soli]TCI11129.1 class I SAM-dependent methyltransferase [Dyella soli]